MTNPVSDLTWATSGYDPGQGVSLEKMDFAPVLAFGAPEVISHTDPADKTTTVSGDTVDQIFAQTGAPSLSQKIISTAPPFGIRDISGVLVNQASSPSHPNSSSRAQPLFPIAAWSGNARPDCTTAGKSDSIQGLQTLTTLEALLLLLVQEGANTPYKLKRDAALSIGSTVPALRKLTKGKLLVKIEGGQRRKTEYHLTKAGARDLQANVKVFMSAACSGRLRVRDAEEAIRLLILAQGEGKRSTCYEIVAAARRTMTASYDATTSRFASDKEDSSTLHKRLLNSLRTNLSRAEQEFIRTLSKEIPFLKTEKMSAKGK